MEVTLIESNVAIPVKYPVTKLLPFLSAEIPKPISQSLPPAFLTHRHF